MKKFYFFVFAFFISTLILKAQVSVVATAGTTSGNYSNLKLAFDAINNGEHQGIITILINASITEIVTARLNVSTGPDTGFANYSRIKIMPTVECTISGNIQGALIELNGADSVTIDGRINGEGTKRSLTIQNSYSVHGFDIATIRLINGATNNIIRYANIEGSAQGFQVGTVYIAGTDNSQTNSYNLIDHNDIRPAGDNRPSSGICAYNGDSSPFNSYNSIKYNLIHDFYSLEDVSAGIQISSFNTNYTITGNSVYQTLPVTGTFSYVHPYISIYYGEGHIISNNYIGGSEPYAGGAPTVYSGIFSIVGINVGSVGQDAPTVIDGNVITNFSLSNPVSSAGGQVSFQGIHTQTGNYSIGVGSGNIIGSLTKENAITLSCAETTAGGSLTGIYCSGSTSPDEIDIQNNQIGSLTVNGTSAKNAYILGMGFGDLTTLNARNNIIGGTGLAGLQNNTFSGSLTGMYLGHQINGAKYVCTQNVVRNLHNNSAGNAEATITGISTVLFPQSGNTITNTISDNQVSNLHTSNISALDGSVRGISTTLYSVNTYSYINNRIVGNQINDLSTASTGGATVVTGITNECPYNQFLIIDSNTIHTLVNAANNASTFSAASVQGISALMPNDAPVNIIGNNIYNLVSTSSAATSVTGINCLYNTNNYLFSLSKNHIYNFENEQAQSGIVAGINLRGSAASGMYEVSNNMISLMPPGNVKVYGIINGTSAAALRLYYNSINIGSTTTGDNSSGAFYRTNSTNTTITSLNNIFQNARSGGNGHHYALMNENATPATGWLLSNSNNFYSKNSAAAFLWGNTALNFAAYKAASHMDSCSTFLDADFADTSNGDLHLQETNKNKMLAGTSVTGITDDFDGDSRHSTPSMGADEIVVSESADPCSGGTLPLKLLSFTAYSAGTKNQLVWITAEEINTAYFDIEKSGDGKLFTKIGSVPAVGKRTNNYSYGDLNPAPGNNFYRLKMTDRDGMFTYSNIQKLYNGSTMSVSVLPNPASDHLTVSMLNALSTDLSFMIVDLRGTVITTKKVKVAAGSSTSTIMIADLPSGIYLLRVITANNSRNFKFVKK